MTPTELHGAIDANFAHFSLEVAGAPTVDFSNLMLLARDRSPQGRADLAATVSDLLDNPTSHEEVSLIGDILLKLVQDAELDLRRVLAEKLAPNPNTPYELLTFLAHDDFMAAEPVLVLCDVLRDKDLIDIIRQRSTDHRCAVAGRSALSGEVQEVVVLSNDKDAIRSLLGNPAVTLCDSVLSMLTETAKHVEDLREPIVARPEINTQFAVKLYWWVSIEVRREIETRFKVSRAEIDEALELTLESMLQSHFQAASVSAEMLDVARGLVKSDKISCGLLIQILRRGRFVPFLALFSALLDLPVAAVEQMLFSHSGETMALASKAVKIIKTDFASLFLLARAARKGDKLVDPKELSHVLAFYDRIPSFMADSILEKWRTDSGILQQKNFNLANLIVETNHDLEILTH